MKQIHKRFNHCSVFTNVPGIYKIVSPSNKIYVGQSWNLLKRIREHNKNINYKKSKLYSSIKKYGYENHCAYVLQEFPKDITQPILDNYEIFYINQLRESGVNLLNLKDGGGAGKPSEEAKKNMSAAQKKSWSSPNRPRTGNRLGIPHTEETKQKIRAANSGKKIHTDKRKEFLKLHWIGNTLTKGINLSEQHKMKISKSLKWGTTSRAIIQQDLQGVFIKEWISATEASEKLNIGRSNIKNNLRGYSKTAHGYIWKYK